MPLSGRSGEMGSADGYGYGIAGSGTPGLESGRLPKSLVSTVAGQEARNGTRALTASLPAGNGG